MLFIGLDDTDTLESRGTGQLARNIASVLAVDCQVLGVTRHQLLLDPRVPYTKKNSCAAIMLKESDRLDPAAIFKRVQTLMLADFQAGSDPGLCIAGVVPTAITEFARRVKRELVNQEEARVLAAAHTIPLLGLGGDEDGVIGALAAVGLAASGEDGRYILVGHSRELSGLQPISALLAAGITAVQTLDGQPVAGGLVQTDKLRPARRQGQPIAFVKQSGHYWQSLKLD